MSHDDIIEDYSPIYVGDVGARLIPHFRDKEKKPISLTGATISMRMQRETPTAIVKDATGTWTIVDAEDGIASFAYSAADVNTDGLWNLLIVITRNGEPIHADAKRLRILPVPALTP